MSSMVKVLVSEDSHGRLIVSHDIWPGDETVEIPPKVYQAYEDALSNLHRAENMIRNIARYQERQRSYADD